MRDEPTWLRPKRQKKWKLITPDIMSEEEDGDLFVRHRPSWRSDTLNRFLEKLERRFKDKHPTSLAEPRAYGEPVQKDPPASIPSWMIRPKQGEDSNESIPDQLKPFSEDHNENGVYLAD